MIPIALTQIPLPVTPVAPVQGKTFAADYFTLAVPTMGNRRRLAIRVLALEYALNKLRSVDYRTNFAQLEQDALSYSGGISQFDLPTAMAAIEWSNAYRVDTSIGTDVAALLANQPQLQQLAEEQLNKIVAFLEAYLAQ